MPETTEDTDLGRFCVLGQSCWGAGSTLAEAKKNFRDAGGSLSKEYGIMTFPEGTAFYGIDSYGRYEFKGDKPTIETIPARKGKVAP